MKVPIYEDKSKDEPLLILVKEFNLLIEDGDLFKENEIGEKVNKDTFIIDKRRQKSGTIKA